MRIAFLGLGKMGTPIVRRLLSAGHSVTIWNRTRERTEALASGGVKISASPAEAVQGQQAVLTSLTDDAAHEAVVFGSDGLLAALESETVHVSLSTISVALSRRLTEEHAHRGQRFVGAPVFGRPNVAADGKLWIAAAGAENNIAEVRPALEAFSRGITVVGEEPWQAHALKLGGNFMITSMVQALSEAFVFARSQGIDPAVFIATVNSALFQSPFYAAYSQVMLNPPEKPGATVTIGLKDTRLFRQAAAASGVELGLADYLMKILETALHNGLGEGEWSVGQYRTAQTLASQESETH
jgi:3-hydroxyisobutyrate dehydrogenase-like beta-hydroxyacid dehydrogenase